MKWDKINLQINKPDQGTISLQNDMKIIFFKLKIK